MNDSLPLVDAGCAKFKIVPKVWGREIWYVNSRLYCHKRLVVNPASYCSLHRHLVKHETFRLVDGRLIIEVEQTRYRCVPGSVIEIPTGSWHRFVNTSGRAAILEEISTHHCDADVERKEPSGTFSRHELEAQIINDDPILRSTFR